MKIAIVSQDSVGNLTSPLSMFKANYVAIDEAHNLKNPSTTRWKSVHALVENISMRRIMTGTPTPNNVLDMWSQFELLRAGCLGYSTFSGFKSAYAVTDSYGGFETVRGIREANIDKLRGAMAACSFVVKKAQCLDLPAKMYATVNVEMPANLRQIYDDFERNFFCELDGGAVVSTEHVIVQILKLAQICSGFVKAIQSVENPNADDDVEIKEDALKYIPGGDAKLNVMLDKAEEAMEGGKLIIWSRFNQDIEVIARRLHERGYKGGKYDSSVSSSDRQKVCDQFCNDDDYRFFVGSPKAGGTGLTLLGTPNVRVHNVFYYSNDFNYGARDQSEDRAHRIGLRNPVLYTDFAYEKTIEQTIAAALQKKKDLSAALKDVGAIKAILLGGTNE